MDNDSEKTGVKFMSPIEERRYLRRELGIILKPAEEGGFMSGGDVDDLIDRIIEQDR